MSNFINDVFNKSKQFLLLYAFFLIFGFYIIIKYSIGDVSLMINANHSFEMDIFFKYYTNIGDGLFYFLIVIVLSFYSFRWALIGLTSFISSGLIVQIIKFFISTPRPKAYFPDLSILHFVPGVDVYSNFSMPSGHTASAFSLFFLLTLLWHKKKLGLNFFLLALLVGISRIYLLQHFFIDVYIGSLIGIIFTIIFYYIFYNSIKINSFKYIDSSILKLKRKN